MHRPKFSMLTFVFLISQVLAYNNSANFQQCYNFTVDLIDPVAYNIQHDNDTFWNATKRYLSLNGCYEHCGPGYQLWPLKDTIDRVSLWVIPALILLTHFSFAPLDIFNFAAVIIHAIGDPIDSIWSLLTRIEVNRRLLRRAKNIFEIDEKRDQGPKNGMKLPRCHARIFFWIIIDCIIDPLYKLWHPDPTTYAEHIAVICAAYEEHGVEATIDHFERVLEEPAERAHQDTISSEQSPPTTVQQQPISPADLLCIREASHELSKSRHTSLVMTLVPILSLALSLASAINRTVHQIEQVNTRLANETAHSIAVLSLFFIFIPIVAFSGVLGSFSTVTGAVEIIEKLRRDLNRDLFPKLPSTIYNWSGEARFSGMNSTYRPRKNIPGEQIDLPLQQRITRLLKAWKTRGPDRSQDLLLFYSLLFVLCGACIPAIFLSATNHADERKVAVGCRTLSWLIITVLWILSLAADTFQFDEPKSKWRYTITKDTFVLITIIILVVFIQIGFYNSCFCRASFSGYVNLNAYNNTEWYQARVLWGTIAPAFFVFNVLLIAWILCVGGNAMGMLCKSQARMLKDAEELEKARVKSRKNDGGSTVRVPIKALEGTTVPNQVKTA